MGSAGMEHSRNIARAGIVQSPLTIGLCYLTRCPPFFSQSPIHLPKKIFRAKAWVLLQNLARTAGRQGGISPVPQAIGDHVKASPARADNLPGIAAMHL